ncbi:PolC-type DNA polymerase III [Mycoplasmopsis verecunda]|uniref:DNA polymerase III PolC-type n=1 Tax=Mycoplasmopsis verecunda TaxID=171291 RepID=A0A1T4LHD0_9BACT|nr:PolC-type DNA polymerase III [Mycoplasmopsis verecunda]WPB54615.1 PolC-type DNA polymerase III [Mycoplasmopsis verecunda]SJZ54008.1 DNA polymerase-3 subunit alpha [Mycoplasmopsis verecunda]
MKYSDSGFQKLMDYLGLSFLSSLKDAIFDVEKLEFKRDENNQIKYQKVYLKSSIPAWEDFKQLLLICKKEKFWIEFDYIDFDLSNLEIKNYILGMLDISDKLCQTILCRHLKMFNSLEYNASNKSWEFLFSDKDQMRDLEMQSAVLSSTMRSFGFKNFMLLPKYIDACDWTPEQDIRNQYAKSCQIYTELDDNYSQQQTGFERKVSDKKYNSNRHYRKSSKNYSTVSIEYINSLAPEVIDIPVMTSGIVYKQDIIERPEFKIYKFYISNYYDALEISYFVNNNNVPEYIPTINDYVEVYGTVANPYSYRGEGPLNKIIKAHSFIKIDNPRNIKQDNADFKRVELSARSKMSTMDGLLDPKDLIEIASKYGHKAVALVDSNGVQGFPEFYHSAKKAGIKPIYGVSFDVIDKNHNFLLNYDHTNPNILTSEYVVLDIETTHLSAQYGELIEFGASVVVDGEIKETHQFFIKAKKPLSSTTINLTNITDVMLENEGYSLHEGLEKIYKIINNRICVAHNAHFDSHFIYQKFIQENMELPKTFFIDTLIVSRYLFSEKREHNLGAFCANLSVVYDANVAHRADYDADVLAQAWIKAMYLLHEKGINRFDELDSIQDNSIYNRTRSSQVTVLALNQKGLKELFNLVTLSLTHRFFGSPKLFLEDLVKSPNLLFGSGGLKSRFLDYMFYSSDLAIKDILDKFDYIEIPHINALDHYIESPDKFSQFEVQDTIIRMIQLAQQNNKIPVAIGDVRYQDKLDQNVFKCLVYSKGIGNATHFLFDYKKAQSKKNKLPDLAFYTTDEMLESFNFIKNDELIQDIVINNPNHIANMVQDDIEVIHKDLYTPKFDNSKDKLYELVYKTAHEKYGEILPPLIEERLKKEITPILQYGFDVIYWISHKLVKKSLDNGYLVGSRGSVGSSLVATMAGITEVNPLPPHYICSKCKNFELVNVEGITSGFDLDDKICPKCNIVMEKDGQTIPFETFLGFNADKVPDIDLNFSGDYQGEIHNEIKRLFGESHTFRAGTISTIKSKTAYGYVRKAVEEYGFEFSNPYIDFLSTKMEGVKRTTGQHPGGIIIIPKEFDVEDFTPINYPADDISLDWKTTHFDFHAIHDNVLKLDILGHVDPTAIRMLERLTGLDVKKDIPKKDPAVMSLFSSTKALNIEPKDIGGEITGALGLPEFGTNFVRRMLYEAKAESFADLISLSGLSHGTDVWTGNAQSLINEKGFTLKDVISCRDDIMVYLINKGVDPLYSFKIMEKVRKGKGLTEEESTQLRKDNVPEWYIDSMKKIKYMFPKAHATAYVLMAWRIAWFKLYYPLEYYATFFTTRVEEFDIQTLKDDYGAIKINKKIKEIEFSKDKKVKDENLMQTLEIARELYARGFNISNIDLKRSLATEWVVDKEHKTLIPPFSAIGGLGEAVANKIVEGRNEQQYMSKEDFKKRSGINITLYKYLNDELGILDYLNETNQMKLF